MLSDCTPEYACRQQRSLVKRPAVNMNARERFYDAHQDVVSSLNKRRPLVCCERLFVVSSCQTNRNSRRLKVPFKLWRLLRWTLNIFHVYFDFKPCFCSDSTRTFLFTNTRRFSHVQSGFRLIPQINLVRGMIHLDEPLSHMQPLHHPNRLFQKWCTSSGGMWPVWRDRLVCLQCLNKSDDRLRLYFPKWLAAVLSSKPVHIRMSFLHSVFLPYINHMSCIPFGFLLYNNQPASRYSFPF